MLEASRGLGGAGELYDFVGSGKRHLGGVVDVPEPEAERLQGVAQGCSAGLVGGGDRPPVPVVAGQALEHHRHVGID